jgi:hypothetical protein
MATTALQAAFYDGNWLVKGWEEDQKITKSSSGDRKLDFQTASAFLGYVMGIADSLNGIMWNLPKNATVKQILSVVGKYLEANPEKWNQAACVLVVEALKSAFPKNQTAELEPINSKP